MNGLNLVQIIGHVGRDPEVKSLDGGNSVAKFSLAVSEKYKDKSGKVVESTEWINCTCFGKLSEVIEKYVHKGDLLYVNGRLKTRTWEKDGEKKYSTEIMISELKMLGGSKAKTEGSASDSHQEITPESNLNPDQGESDLPF